MADDTPSIDIQLELWRIALAVEALIWILRGDPRVQTAYAAWRQRILDAGTTRAAIMAAVRAHKRRDLTRLDRLVSRDLQLPYAWLASYLLADFGQLLAGAGVRLTPEMPADMPPSYRRLKDDGRFVAEYVWWYYRHEIQPHRDTLYAIAKDRRDQQRAAGVHARVNVSHIETGIRLAKQWLNAVVLAPSAP